MDFIKGQNVKLTYGLTSSEFECKCRNDACMVNKIGKDLIGAYRRFRGLVGIPLKVNSGYRCPAHNSAVGGSKNSYHVKGLAIDIDLENLKPKFSIDEICLMARDAGFTFIKVYSNFIHLDKRKL